MIIELPKLHFEGEQVTGEEPAELLKLGDAALIQSVGPIQYGLFVQLVGHELVVQGQISTVLAATCGRCAEIFSTNLMISDFLRTFEVTDGQEAVDVTDDIREEVLLNLPHYPLCSTECKGLCPQCGGNLNIKPCKCRAKTSDLRWSGLDDLKLK